MFGKLPSLATLVLFGMFAASPTSTNFTLKSYDFGSGGGSSTSTNYALNGEAGEQSASGLGSTNFKINSGLPVLNEANVPAAPTFTNPSNEYNRLRIVINTSNNPTDTLYQIAISSDGFSTTQYVQTDNTVGTTNTVAQYQSYVAWGGATGVWITGLQANTSYQVKVRALQGKFSGTAYGPTASAATVLPSLTFSVATSLTATPPFAIGFSSLAAGAVTNGSATAELGLSTNALNGGVIYIKSTGSLSSALAAASVPSASADLSVVASGYGAIVTSASQAAGGPLSAVAPYNGSGNNVGVLTTALQPIVSSSSAVTTGAVSVTFKAKIDATTPAASDYTDTLTFVAAMLY